MRFFRRATIVLLVVMVSACGGGGSGGSNYSISLSASSLTFDVQEDAVFSPQSVSVTFVGDGVVVGSLPGQTPPAWLSVSAPGTAAGGHTSVQVGVKPGTPAGNYSFTLRFVTGKADGSNVVYVDLPVSATVHESFGLVAGGAFTFTGLEGGTTAVATGSTSLSVKGENVSWHASATQPWIQLGQTSGSGRGPLPFTVSLAGVSAGSYSGQINVSDDISGESTFTIVLLTVTGPRLTTSLQSINFNVDAATTASNIQADLAISDELQGQNAAESYQWSVTAGTSFLSSPVVSALQLTPASGNTTGAPTHVSVSLDLTKLNGLPSQVAQTGILISYKRASDPTFTNTVAIPVTVTVRLPRANVASPFIVSPNAGRRLSIIGNDFRDEDLPKLRIAGIASPTLTRLSSQEIALDLPSLPIGQYAVTFQNSLGLTRSTAEISVQGPAAIGAGVMVSSGPKSRLVLAAARGMLYAANPGSQQIERYHWDGANWNALPATALPAVNDITPARNGRELYASADDGYYSLDLTTSGSSTTNLTNIPAGLCGSNPLFIVATELGGLMGSLAGNGCSGLDVLSYDALSKTLMIQEDLERTLLARFYRAVLATSGDGRYVAIGQYGSTPSAFGVFDLRTGAYVGLLGSAVGSITGGYTSHILDMDGSGTKVIVNNLFVLAPTGTLLGQVPANRITRLSADGTKAYIYIHADGGLGKIQVIDLTASIAPGGTFPVLSEVAVPYDMGDSPAEGLLPAAPYNFAMTVSPDERFVFLSGTSRIAVVALP